MNLKPMATSLHHLLTPPPLPLPLLLPTIKPNSLRYPPQFTPPTTSFHCSSSPNPIPESTITPAPTTEAEPDTAFDAPSDSLSTTDPSLAVSKRVQSGITRQSGPVVSPLEPPNFEIGWKRTKEIKTEKPKGWLIADFLEKLDGLMERGRYGSTKLLAKTAAIVVERASEEAEVLRAKGEVDDRVVIELQRVLRLVELDAEMVKAAVKEDTLKERIETTRARCRQAILVALSL